MLTLFPSIEEGRHVNLAALVPFIPCVVLGRAIIQNARCRSNVAT